MAWWLVHCLQWRYTGLLNIYSQTLVLSRSVHFSMPYGMTQWSKNTVAMYVSGPIAVWSYMSISNSGKQGPQTVVVLIHLVKRLKYGTKTNSSSLNAGKRCIFNIYLTLLPSRAREPNSPAVMYTLFAFLGQRRTVTCFQTFNFPFSGWLRLVIRAL